MNKDDRLKRSVLMKRLMEKDEASYLSIKEFCELLKLNGLWHSHGYFHYTTLSALQKMLAPVDVGAQKKRLFRLSSASSLNDKRENKPGVYLASFSIGREEDVAMWTNYGIPRREAVRIKFPMAAMTEWMRENPCDRIVIYAKEREEQDYQVLSEKPVEISLADVAYYAGNEPLPQRDSDAVHYRGEHLKFKDKKWRMKIQNTNDSLLFKKRGWAYEREVRLIVRFEDVAKMQKYAQIALPFDLVYEKMLEVQEKAEKEGVDSKKCVMLGPWHDKDRSHLSEIKLINAPSHSSFQNELKMRSICDCCDQKGTEKCTCQKAEWK